MLQKVPSSKAPPAPKQSTAKPIPSQKPVPPTKSSGPSAKAWTGTLPPTLAVTGRPTTSSEATEPSRQAPWAKTMPPPPPQDPHKQSEFPSLSPQPTVLPESACPSSRSRQASVSVPAQTVKEQSTTPAAPVKPTKAEIKALASNEEVVKATMMSAAERAKKRRMEEEAERDAQKERAKKKAAELEAKLAAAEAEKKEKEEAQKRAKEEAEKLAKEEAEKLEKSKPMQRGRLDPEARAAMVERARKRKEEEETEREAQKERAHRKALEIEEAKEAAKAAMFERARKRKEEEEAEREAQKVRARQKALELEAKLVPSEPVKVAGVEQTSPVLEPDATSSPQDQDWRKKQKPDIRAVAPDFDKAEAIERARKRRDDEEAERDAQKERARQKARELELKLTPPSLEQQDGSKGPRTAVEKQSGRVPFQAHSRSLSLFERQQQSLLPQSPADQRNHWRQPEPGTRQETSKEATEQQSQEKNLAAASAFLATIKISDGPDVFAALANADGAEVVDFQDIEKLSSLSSTSASNHTVHTQHKSVQSPRPPPVGIFGPRRPRPSAVDFMDVHDSQEDSREPVTAAPKEDENLWRRKRNTPTEISDEVHANVRGKKSF